VPPALLRAKFRSVFERNRNVTDVAVLDVMLHKGWQEYQETMNVWKQTPHVMKWFAEEEAPGTLHTARLRLLTMHSQATDVPREVLRYPRPGSWADQRGDVAAASLY